MGYKQYCKNYQDIENYEAAKKDNFKEWCCHHRLETHTSDGKRREVDITVAELQALGMYYNRPASELIFMKHNEHSSLHKPSDDTKKKIAETHKGENNPMYGKHLSEEARKKNSEAHKGKKFSEEHKNKIGETKKGNTYVRGRHWYNNGDKCIRAKECPPGFVPGRLRK